MSGSNKKQTKANSPEEAMKQQRSQRLAAEEKKKQTTNNIIGGIIAVVVLGLVFWNQGFYQSSTAAFTIDGTKYTAAHVQLYYTDVLYGALMGNYSPEEGGADYDFQTPANEQAYSSNATWHDFFTEEAARTLAEIHVLSQTAKSSGYKLPEEALNTIADTKSNLDTIWIGYSTSKKAFIKSQYGMSESDYLAVLEMELYANYFQSELYENFEFSDAEYEAYYADNTASLDVITYSQFQFVASHTPQYDEDGNELEMTEEDEVIFEGMKTIMEAQATDAQLALVDGATLEEVEEEFGEFISHSYLHNQVVTSKLTATDSASNWILNEEREVGEIAKTSDTVGNNVYYSVTVYEGRERATANVVDLRHILIPANLEDPYGEIEDEMWDESKEYAQEILDQWVADGADAEAFAQLAMDNSQDPTTASDGGLLSSVTLYDGYDENLTAWFSDSSRKEGDYAIVEHSQTYPHGWNIVYFEEMGLPLWEENTRINLSNEKITAWKEDTLDGVAERIVFGNGKAYVTAQSLF